MKETNKMSVTLKFPPTVEIKRAIAAAERAGIDIDSIEIHPRKIMIHCRQKGEPELTYAEWKMSQQRQD